MNLGFRNHVCNIDPEYSKASSQFYLQHVFYCIISSINLNVLLILNLVSYLCSAFPWPHVLKLRS